MNNIVLLQEIQRVEDLDCKLDHNLLGSGSEVCFLQILVEVLGQNLICDAGVRPEDERTFHFHDVALALLVKLKRFLQNVHLNFSLFV